MVGDLAEANEMFIEDGGDRFLMCEGLPINMISDFCGLS